MENTQKYTQRLGNELRGIRDSEPTKTYGGGDDGAAFSVSFVVVVVLFL